MEPDRREKSGQPDRPESRSDRRDDAVETRRGLRRSAPADVRTSAATASTGLRVAPAEGIWLRSRPISASTWTSSVAPSDATATSPTPSTSAKSSSLLWTYFRRRSFSQMTRKAIRIDAHHPACSPEQNGERDRSGDRRWNARAGRAPARRSSRAPGRARPTRASPQPRRAACPAARRPRRRRETRRAARARTGRDTRSQPRTATSRGACTRPSRRARPVPVRNGRPTRRASPSHQGTGRAYARSAGAASLTGYGVVVERSASTHFR